MDVSAGDLDQPKSRLVQFETRQADLVGRRRPRPAVSIDLGNGPHLDAGQRLALEQDLKLELAAAAEQFHGIALGYDLQPLAQLRPANRIIGVGVTDDMEDRSIAVTAAHCVYENEGSSEFATNWMYIPQYEAIEKDLHILNNNTLVCEDAPHGCYTTDTLVVHDGFASAGGFNGAAIQYDFAFAVLDADLESIGAQAIAFGAVSKGTSAYAFGYPHDPTFNHDLTYCAGGLNFDNRFFKLTYKLKCDMTGGASGGPWFSSFNDGTGTVMSVNSYGYAGGGAMYGPKFNTNTQDLFEAAKATTSSCIETIDCP